jgi:hypothetical protein
MARLYAKCSLLLLLVVAQSGYTQEDSSDVAVPGLDSASVETSSDGLDSLAPAPEPERAPDKYSLRFSENDLIALQGELVGTNILVRNNSSESGSFSLEINIPSGWKLFGGKKTYSFEAGEEKIVPIRLLPNNLLGSTRFVINVLVFDELGNQVTGNFFFVGSKKVVEWDVAINPGNNIYLKNGETSTKFDVNVLNLGNFKQDIVMSMKGIRSGLMLKDEEGTIIDNPRYSLSLGRLEDTTFKYCIETTTEMRNFRQVSLQEHKPESNDYDKTYSLFVNTAEAKMSGDNLKQKGHRLNLIRLANDQRVNQFSGPVVPLIVDANFQNILSRNTFLNLILRGFQTFNDGSNFVYFNQLTFSRNTFNQQFLDNGTYYGGYFNKNFTVELGNVSGGNFGLPSAGLGGKGSVRVYGQHWLGGYWMRRSNIFLPNDLTTYGGFYSYRGSGLIRGTLGVGRSVDNTRNRAATVGTGRVGIRLGQSHTLTLLGAYSDREAINSAVDTFQRSGFMYGATYSGRYLKKKLVTNISGRIQQPTFGLTDNQRRIVNGRIQYFVRPKSNVYFNSTFNENIYSVTSSIPGSPSEFNNMIFFNALGYSRTTRFGTVQNYGYYNINSIVGKRIISPGLGVRYSNYIFDKNILYAVNVQGGYDNALFLPDLPWYFRMNFNALVRVRTLSIVSGYFYGPNSPAAAETMYETGLNPIFLRTAFNHQYLFKNQHFVLQNNLNHSYQNNLNSHRIGTFPEFFYFTNDGWRFSVGLNYALTTRKLGGGIPLFGDQEDLLSDERITSSSTQVNATVRKEFGIRIPFIKDKNFTQEFIAFYDLDGDGEKGRSEPPMENVVIRLGGNEVLTNHDGISILEYVPAGYHQLVVFSLEKLEGWFPNVEDSLLIFQGQKQFIPFVKGVKVYGKVAVDREKVSTNGDKPLDLSSIKINADGEVNDYGTLTDFEGNFDFYLPNGKYVLSMDEGILGSRYRLVRNNFPMMLESGMEGLYFTFNIIERKRSVKTKKFGSNGTKISRPNGAGAEPIKVPRVSPPPAPPPGNSERGDDGVNGMPFRIPSPEEDGLSGDNNFPRRVIGQNDNTPNIQPLLDAPVIDPDQLKFIVDLGTFTEKVPTNLFNLIIDLGYSNEDDAGQNELQFLSARFATQQEANAVLQRAIGLGLTDPRPQLIGEYEGRRLNSEQMQQLSLKLQQQDPNARPTEPIQW